MFWLPSTIHPFRPHHMAIPGQRLGWTGKRTGDHPTGYRETMQAPRLTCHHHRKTLRRTRVADRRFQKRLNNSSNRWQPETHSGVFQESMVNSFSKQIYSDIQPPFNSKGAVVCCQHRLAFLIWPPSPSIISPFPHFDAIISERTATHFARSFLSHRLSDKVLRMDRTHC